VRNLIKFGSFVRAEPIDEQKDRSRHFSKLIKWKTQYFAIKYMAKDTVAADTTTYENIHYI